MLKEELQLCVCNMRLIPRTVSNRYKVTGALLLSRKLSFVFVHFADNPTSYLKEDLTLQLMPENLNNYINYDYYQTAFTNSHHWV